MCCVHTWNDTINQTTAHLILTDIVLSNRIKELKGSILLGPAAEPRLNVSSVFCPLMFGMGNVRILTADKVSVVGLQQNGWKKKESNNLGMSTVPQWGKLVIGRNLWEYHGLEMKEIASQ